MARHDPNFAERRRRLADPARFFSPLASHAAIAVAIRSPFDPESRPAFERWKRAVADAEQLRANQFLVRADRADTNAERLADMLMDSSRPPKIAFIDSSGEHVELPELGLANVANWVDPQVSPVPLQIGAQEDVNALRIVAAMISAATSDESAGARAQLDAALRLGLAHRVGRQLSDSELAVYLTLRTLAGTRPPGRGARVCESCTLVFEGVSAFVCRRCHRSPPRATQRPWHVTVTAGDRRVLTTNVTISGNVVIGNAALRRAGTPRRTTYSCSCAGCGRTFTCHDARRRRCDACGTGAQRMARARERKASVARAIAPPETPETPAT